MQKKLDAMEKTKRETQRVATDFINSTKLSYIEKMENKEKDLLLSNNCSAINLDSQ